MKHLYEQPRPLREVNPGISPQFEAVVMCALEKDPANRYHSPTEFLQALIAATSTVASVATMDTASPTVMNTWQQQILTRLTTDTDGSQSLCPSSQYYWSNVSHDGSTYALQGFNPGTNEYKMLFGSTSGGNPTVFADISDGTTMQLAGWTTM